VIDDLTLRELAHDVTDCAVESGAVTAVDDLLADGLQA
jgi:hypothetical protein